jgi:hypothetical protein
MVLNHSEEDDDNVDDINCSYRVYEIESQYMKSDYCQLVLFVDEEMICF